jgi:maleylpyruvate isomerase
MEAVNKYNLYSYWRSSCSWRVRIVLNMKNIHYTITPIHLVKDGGEQLKDQFIYINPVQRVPVLEFERDGKMIHLIESSAICEYLEEQYPEPALLPKDCLEKAVVRSLCSEIGSNIQPIQNLAVINRVATIGGNKVEWANYWIAKGLDALEIMLSKTRGKYCVGDSITLADAFLIPQLYNARRFNVDMSKYPIITEIEKNLVDIEAFKNAHPDNQPDAEK